MTSTIPSFHTIEPSDVNQLMPIENACHGAPWSENTFKSCIGGRYFSQYINKDNKAIGFYVGEYVAGEATLMNICVEPSQQGNGFGKVLLLQFLTEAKKQGSSKVFLEVRASNFAAQMLYINQGFTEIDRRIAYYPSVKGFGYEDAIVMQTKL